MTPAGSVTRVGTDGEAEEASGQTEGRSPPPTMVPPLFTQTAEKPTSIPAGTSPLRVPVTSP